MPFCSNCGAANSSTAKFCTKCGVALVQLPPLPTKEHNLKATELSNTSKNPLPLPQPSIKPPEQTSQKATPPPVPQTTEEQRKSSEIKNGEAANTDKEYWQNYNEQFTRKKNFSGLHIAVLVLSILTIGFAVWYFGFRNNPNNSTLNSINSSDSTNNIETPTETPGTAVYTPQDAQSNNHTSNQNQGTTSTQHNYDVAELLHLNNYDKLLELYPGKVDKSNLEIIDEGGEEGIIYTIFPNSSDEIFVVVDTKAQLYEISSRENKSKWRFPYGLKVGMSLQELVSLNQKPILFYGFGWDDEGKVNWNGGQLQGKGINATISYDGAFREELNTTNMISSDDVRLKKNNFFVSRIGISRTPFINN